MKKPLILEVGSGDNPRDKSDILLDRFIYSNDQRAGKFKIRINRPIVVGDGYTLPFKDKQFDYVICSHVLEHMRYPDRFAKELMRVGKAGYIEVPNIYGERLFGWGFHLWHCEYKNKSLIMTPKKHKERFGEFFHRLIAKELWFRRFFEEHEKTFYIKFEWKDSFRVVVNRSPHTENYLLKIDRKIDELLKKVEWNKWKDIQFYARWMGQRIVKKAKKELRQFIWNLQILIAPKSIVFSLIPLLRCVKCHANVSYTKKTIYCTKCHATYPLESTIPIMLLNKDRKKGY